MDCSPPSSSVHGISQARILRWVAISFSRGSSRPSDWTWVSHIAGRFFTVWATRQIHLYPLVLFNSPSLHHHCLFYLAPHSLCFRYSTSVFEGWREMGWGVCVWTLVRITSRSFCLAWPWGRISALQVNWLWPFATPWIAAHQAPLFLGFFRQAYWSGLPFPSPGDLPSSRDQTWFACVSLLQADSLSAEPSGKLKQIGTKSQLLNQHFTHVN